MFKRLARAPSRSLADTPSCHTHVCVLLGALCAQGLTHDVQPWFPDELRERIRAIHARFPNGQPASAHKRLDEQAEIEKERQKARAADMFAETLSEQQDSPSSSSRPSAHAW